MNHATRDALDAFVFKVKNIEGTDAPTVVVAVLPVVHAVFPPAFVTAPPFASDIAVLQPPFRGTQCIRFATLVIDAPGSQTKIKGPSQSDATDNEGTFGVM